MRLRIGVQTLMVTMMAWTSPGQLGSVEGYRDDSPHSSAARPFPRLSGDHPIARRTVR